jgi:hypothetical protein
MPNITTVAELRKEIQVLEKKHSAQGQLLKKRFDDTVESFKPASLIKSGFSGDLLNTAFAMVTGYLSRRILLGSTGKLLNKLIDNVLQYGITALLLRKNQTGSAS